jgi:hypothetical protein
MDFSIEPAKPTTDSIKGDYLYMTGFRGSVTAAYLWHADNLVASGRRLMNRGFDLKLCHKNNPDIVGILELTIR